MQVDTSKLDKATLHALAESHGVEISGRATNADIADALEKAHPNKQARTRGGTAKGSTGILPDFVEVFDGESSEEAMMVQLLLKRAGHSVQVDGHYGWQTKDEVAKFRADNGMPEGGIDRELIEKLLSVGRPPRDDVALLPKQIKPPLYAQPKSQLIAVEFPSERGADETPTKLDVVAGDKPSADDREPANA